MSPTFQKQNFFQVAALCTWVLAAGLLVLSLGPVMHESDQASLLSGAWKLGHGDAPFWKATFYNYDKQFLSYWYVALWLKLFPGFDPVTIGNLSTFTAFWASIFIFLIRNPVRSAFQAACAIGIILAPAFLQHSAFLASNFLAAACLILGAAVWKTPRVGEKIAGVLLFSAAVGARADVLALLPAMAWCLLPRRGLFRWLTNPWLWAIAIGGLLVFVAGRLLAGARSTDIYELFLIPKILAAYSVFGLGAVCLVLFCWMAGWLLIAFTRKRLFQKIYYCAGATVFLPMLAFYSVQMFSTRHWVTLIAAALVGVLSRKGRTLFADRRPMSIPLTTLTAAAAILPIFIGILLPFPNRPRISWGPGTSFPTADGLISMGGYASWMITNRRLHFFHDHNQAVWLSSKEAKYEAGPDGKVPFLETPMYSYYELAATLKGLSSEKVLPGSPYFYIDSRSISRESPQLASGEKFTYQSLLTSKHTSPVSPQFNNICMLRVEAGAPSEEAKQLSDLMEIFQKNEFFKLASATAAADPKWDGHSIVFYKPKGSPTASSEISNLQESDTLLFLKVAPDSPNEPTFSTQCELLQKLGFQAAVSALPSYMSLNKL